MPKVLDPCCGSRMMWFDKQDQRALFGDCRRESRTVPDRTYTRHIQIHPDVQLDFRRLPFADNTFHLVGFDPPHLKRAGKNSWLALKYGKLGNRWQDDIAAGLAECFRVLKPNGTLVFKWNENQIRTQDVLALTPHKPLFGHTAGRRGGNHLADIFKIKEIIMQTPPLDCAEVAKHLNKHMAAAVSYLWHYPDKADGLRDLYRAQTCISNQLAYNTPIPLLAQPYSRIFTDGLLPYRSQTEVPNRYDAVLEIILAAALAENPEEARSWLFCSLFTIARLIAYY